ncbi:MAG: phosphoglycerate mutase family protein [Actinobacteria bacterium]|nr:phosphoglycerate mutase family protein [Actinomycetota bacterium]
MPRLPHLQRDEAPLYLARYYEREARREARRPGDGAPADAAADADPHSTHAPIGRPTTGDDTPLYLRRFRERRESPSITEPAPPLWQRSGAGMQRALSEDNRNKEIIAPRAARREVTNDVYLIRHGETQGYSTEAGLTPLGSWQAHTWGHTLAKRIRDGEEVVVASAATNRAGQTAGQLHKGLLDGLAMFEKDVKVHDPRALPEFRNFAVATPDGLRDVTGAFRRYYAVLERFERTATGDRPTWLVEIDRFWRVQQGGGDPIEHWLSTPMLHFEPPALCVRRFWAGILRLAADHPRARLTIATHSGPIRAFAVWALGYDPGEPYNTEHVRVKLMAGDGQALVSYRNRVQPVQIPDVTTLPTWSLEG